MSNKQAGFTLMEAMIAAVIMATALAVASLFAYSARTNVMTGQMTTATFLANTKMEQIRDQQFNTVGVGGGLDPASPTANYFEYITINANGTIATSTVNATAPFIRLWQVSGASPRLVTVAVFARSNGVSGRTTELMRASMELSNGL
jgi:prepilin-type N-terminal cleavage/methylation domain-containing protein